MTYWLYTWDHPDTEIENGQWAIYQVTREFEDEDEGLDMIEIGDIVYDPKPRPQWQRGEISDIYDDAVTDNPRRVIAFLFDQRFW